jgi:hypothetical protein
MGMILRFIDKDTLVFKSVVLGCMLWDEAHDAGGTAEMMRKVLGRWDLTDADVDMATTDNASVMIACIRDHFPNWTRLACTPHTLQLPLTRQLQGSYTAVPVAREEGGRRSETLEQQWQGPGPEKVHQLFKRVRVVTNFHTNRPNSKLQHILYNRAVADGEVEGERVGCFLKPGETRWTGLYLMGKALYENHAYTLKFSYDNPGAADCCLAPDDYQLLAQVLAVLEPFTAAMDIFQNTDNVSISLVYPELLQIVKALEDVEGEIEVGGKSMAVASLDPSVQELRKGLRDELFSRFFSMQNGTAGEVYKHFVTYGSAAYLDPRNIPAQALFHTLASDGRSLFYHMGTALLALCAKNKAGVVAFLQRELARNPTAPWVTRATLLDGAGAAQRAAAGEERGGAPAADGGGDPPPAKRARNWRDQMAVAFLAGDRAAGGGGVGRAGDGSRVGGGRSASLLIKEGMVDALLREEMEKYAVYWTAEHVRVHGFPLPGMKNCPLKQFWIVHRETMPVLCFLAHLTLSIRPSSADVERLFSTAGFVFSDRRQSMNDVRFDDLMIIKANWENKYLEFTKEEQEAKKAKREAHNKAISAAMKQSHAAKKAGQKKLAQKTLLGGIAM